MEVLRVVEIISKDTRMTPLKSAVSDSCCDRLHKTTEKIHGFLLENLFMTVFFNFPLELVSADLTAQVMSCRHQTCFVVPRKFPLQGLSWLSSMQMLMS